jgi:hypothetical protein
MRTTVLVTALLTSVAIACSSSGSNGSAPPAGGDSGVTAPPLSTNADASSPGSGGADAGSPSSADGSSPGDASAEGDACPPPSEGGTGYSITGNITLTLDADAGDAGVAIGTQNGSFVYFAASDLVGKNVVWATAPGGVQVANLAVPTEFGSTTIGADLTAHFTSSPKYTDGPWELAVYVSVTGGSLLAGPQAGDIAAFDLTPPPPCQPPVTGVSIRVTIDDANAVVNIPNSEFIVFP